MIKIKFSPLGKDCRNVYQNGEYIASINKPTKTDPDYLVCWLSGRVDRHATYAEAKNNVMHGV